LQIGAPAVIAAETGITTIADFRPADVAAGGQGAPLTSFADAALFRHETAFRAVQNIGGIGNVTLLPPRRSDRPVTAFDTGPGNMLIDDAAGRIAGLPFDRDGALAARGRVREGLLMELMHHPFIAQAPPKSTGRETFGAAFADSVWARWKGQIPSEDLIATLTAFTAASIADAYTRFAPAPIDEVYVGGGGALNPVLMRMLAERLAPARVYDHDALKIPAKAKESVAFALLAYATWHNHPGAVPSCTGAERAAILGAISPGRNYGALLGDIRH
jgi:anhydro-N-acetylmuramic acid kinase